MQRPGTDIASRAQAVMTALDGPGRDLGQAADALESLRAAIPSGKTPREHWPELGRTVLAVSHALDTTTDRHFIRVALAALLDMSTFGRAQVLRFASGRTIPPRELETIVAGMEGRSRLALAQQLLTATCRKAERMDTTWAESLAASLENEAHEDLLPFVASLGAEGARLAYPLAATLNRFGFRDWLLLRLAGRGDDEMPRLALLALDDPELAGDMAANIVQGEISATPGLIRDICRTAVAGDKNVREMLRIQLQTPDANMAGACMDGFLMQERTTSGKAAAVLAQNYPNLRKAILPRIPLLGEEGLARYLSATPRTERDQAVTDTFATLCRIAPEFVRTALGRHTESFTDLLPPSPAIAPSPLPVPEPPSDSPRVGLLGKLLGKGDDQVKRLSARVLRDADLSGVQARDLTLSNREWKNATLSRATLSDLGMSRTSISGCIAQEGLVLNSSFSSVSFRHAIFSGTRFSGTRFTDCVFDGCDLTNVVIDDCVFRNCRFKGTQWTKADIRDSRFLRTEIADSILAATRLHHCTIKTSRLERCDLSKTRFTLSSVAGFEARCCLFRGLAISDSSFLAAELDLCPARGCRISGSDTAHPILLEARERTLLETAARLQTIPAPGMTCLSGKQLQTAKQVLLAWVREHDILRRESRMAARNLSRTRSMRRRMSPEQAAFVKLLPHLLNTDIFETRFKLDNVPPCRMWGHAADLTTMELAEQFLPGTTPGRRKPKVTIAALYAMGSTGTMAQTEKSDLDCWLCLNDTGMDMESEAGLERKLRALELWADSEFGLELHFFPMTMHDIRNNIFAAGDEESSGTAQALLLKEEFYRTALRLAGKRLAWWTMPPGADARTYAARMRSVARYPLAGIPRFEDFGHLARFPADEFFGASLWQMVKAVHSPFKSVMKIALLEHYANLGESGLSLCDEIKRNLFLRHRDVTSIDPYAAMFRTLLEFYQTKKATDAVHLLADSFRLKADLSDARQFLGLPARPEDVSLARALKHAEKGRKRTLHRAGSFAHSLETGAAVRRFMVAAYKNIQSGIAGGGQARISPEDLTRLGRRVSANFSSRRNKVTRVPFLDQAGQEFQVLHFSAEKAPGKRHVWVLRGGQKDDAKASASTLQELHRNHDPGMMVAWILANRMYGPQKPAAGRSHRGPPCRDGFAETDDPPSGIFPL
ncbi:class I adenylate cyclase [Pseudodesulfovibrio tunisiensis]|uniref:class I adenylate cyclase n=1 Tax=Pseudodesulfovibrio tunisiensis TaxID=463192 RepID=UPI001FB1CD44|nr:class I adenylate cyclase [Pseudodesulfovibrio tunisiensis]